MWNKSTLYPRVSKKESEIGGGVTLNCVRCEGDLLAVGLAAPPIPGGRYFEVARVKFAWSRDDIYLKILLGRQGACQLMSYKINREKWTTFKRCDSILDRLLCIPIVEMSRCIFTRTVLATCM